MSYSRIHSFAIHCLKTYDILDFFVKRLDSGMLIFLSYRFCLSCHFGVRNESGI